jgi:hypothetical protein
MYIFGGMDYIDDNEQIIQQDFWKIDVNSIEKLIVAVAPLDTPTTSSYLLSTLYFMVSVLTLMMAFFVLFVINMRRRQRGNNGRRGSQRFFPVLLPEPGRVGARIEVIQALPTITYAKADKSIAAAATAAATTVAPGKCFTFDMS